MLTSMENYLPFRNFEHHREKSNGEIVYLSISGVPVFENDGTFIGYRGIGRDITEQFINQQALNEALAASKRANQAKTEFLATMSHEFCTPLNAILGLVKCLEPNTSAPLARKIMRSMHLIFIPAASICLDW
jgi:signal transduction histidine kinase